MTRQLEPQIKAVTLNYLIDQGMLSEEQTLINEFTLDGYTGRVDLAILSKKLSIAIEIKSEADSLSRLSGQTDKYLKYFDKVIIVAARKHIPNIIKSVPQHVAVWEVFEDSISIKRRGRIIIVKNKSSFLSLMKVNELLKLSNKLGISLSSKKRKAATKALENIPANKLRDAALQSVQDRYALTSSSFWKRVQGNKVLPEHMALLSPYNELRLSQKQSQKEKELFWNNLLVRSIGEEYFTGTVERKNIKLFEATPKHFECLLAI